MRENIFRLKEADALKTVQGFLYKNEKVRRLRDVYPAHHDRRISVKLKKTTNTES